MGQVKVDRSTELWVNKIKKLDPITYESMLDRMKEVYEIRELWLKENDSGKEETLLYRYYKLAKRIEFDMLELFKDGSTDCGEINLFEIYRRLQWNK